MILYLAMNLRHYMNRVYELCYDYMIAE